MSDTTPRPEDENPPVPPAAGTGPLEPESPAAPAEPAAPVPPAETAGGPTAPPPGAYPPPPAGAYPPPAGAYPPPPAGYPATAGPGSQVDVVESFKWGWKKFTENVGPILIAILVYVLATVAVVAVWYFIVAGIFLGTSETTIDEDGTIRFGSGPNLFAVLFSGALITLVAVLLFSIMQAGFIQGALRISRGEPLSLDTFFKFKNLTAVIVASLLVAVLTSVGYLLCYLPGVAVALFAQFTLYYVVDRGVGAVDAIKASYQLVVKNFGTTILLFLGILVVSFIGSLLCGVGTLVALPVSLLAQAYVFRRLNDEPVAP
ncbi:hypothetical protein [Cellulomonas persica]|uniref:Integral membrane protein n=1 Tax=Cellulomonas persica TaxID=76861 RepID=A0A510UYD8_9CELL|nr:hypothetical protein [Cellulomonas persica]GEK17825.1 hypothetical protein CPE01_15580 [Cellulomonas persica]